MTEDRVKLGCLGWAAAVLVISWPLYELGLGENVAIIGGVVGASLLVVGLQFRHGWRQGMAEQRREGDQR